MLLALLFQLLLLPHSLLINFLLGALVLLLLPDLLFLLLPLLFHSVLLIRLSSLLLNLPLLLNLLLLDLLPLNLLLLNLLLLDLLPFSHLLLPQLLIPICSGVWHCGVAGIDGPDTPLRLTVLRNGSAIRRVRDGGGPVLELAARRRLLCLDRTVICGGFYRASLNRWRANHSHAGAG